VILAIDTSIGTSIAVVDGENVLSQHSTSDTMRHAEVVGQMIQECLSDAGIEPAQITHVAAGMGPGPFTGLRVGIAASYAFALGSGATLLPMVSHGALALERLESDRQNSVVITTDARRKEEYVSFYAGVDDAGCPIVATAAHLQKPGEFVADGAGNFAATEVSAAWLGRLAHRMLLAGRSFPPAEALYLRSPDVTMPNAPKRVNS
jgi:tRNA threonylcarbamoyl adenosine modification protein YeaZ